MGVKTENESKKKKIAVLGATGYTGMELIRLLTNHPGVEISFVSSESYAGAELSEVLPQFYGLNNIRCSSLETETVPSEVEFVFCALPHGRSMEVVPALLNQKKRVIDLSADFRLKDSSLYPQWYERDHLHPELLLQAVYGLSEIYRQEVRETDLLANPGCFPTGIILALAPLLTEDWVDMESIIVDAKTGVSGGGRSPKQPFHFSECSDSFKAYRVANHQHTPEIEQELNFLQAGKLLSNQESKSDSGNATITFAPHLVPMNRGILTTIYFSLRQKLSAHDIISCYQSFYREEFFVKVFEHPILPETRWVRGTNFCHLGIRLDERNGRVIVISAIDNLVKGAAGQAVQNMNIMSGWAEETGLNYPAMVP